jgi:radical SAM superfamily enzyme YgiQ (UPF0313 family)
MKRALLVNPWTYDFKSHDFWVKPYGLLRISTFLKNNGFEVDLIDCMDRHDPDMAPYKTKDRQFGTGEFYHEDLAKPEPYKRVPRKYKRYGFPVDIFKKKLDGLKIPDIILVTSGVSYSFEGVLLAMDLITDRFQSVKTILGGIYATLCPGHAQKHSKANLVWQGDINNLFIKALNQYTRSSIEQVPDAKFKELPPDYSFYPTTPYAAVKFTQGCPFNCTYCAIKQLCPSYYQREPAGIIKELEGYKAAGKKSIAFYDDALLYKNFFIKGVLKEIMKKGMKFVFHASNGLHASYIDAEAAMLMKQAGFVEPRVSLETTDYELQKSTGNKTTTEAFEKAINHLRKAGFRDSEIGVYILAGLPGQDEESVMADVEYLKDMNLKIKPAVYSPIPGTMEFMKLRPDLRAALNLDPLKQNEYYFLTVNTQYNWEANLRVKAAIDEHNKKLGEEAEKDEE